MKITICLEVTRLTKHMGRLYKKQEFKTSFSKYGGPVFVICLGLGVVLSIIDLFPSAEVDWPHWLRHLGIRLIFAETIGFSNLVLCLLLPDPNTISKKIWRYAYLAGEFTVGSLTGTIIALHLNHWLWGLTFRSLSLTKFILLVVFFSLLSAFGIYAYFMIKEKLENTAVALREKHLQTERLEKLKAAAELSALQATIQPHFLFNTLNSIAALIREEPKLAEDTIEKLAELFRYVLNANRREWIQLGEEIEIVRNYLEIEKLRLGERLRYHIDVDENLLALPVPALLIQPLVENSIKHGIGTLEEGGEILISAKSHA
ncbi:MAG: histidine kinase, partial [candidate division KSB1 bacterium]|nr:histidine kinase [candidate division KSB1 bacterium]